MADFTFDASLGADGSLVASPEAHVSPSRAWPCPTIRTATLTDLEPLTEVLASSFYDRTGWLAWLYPLIKLGIQEDLKQRLKSHQAHYACLVVVAPQTAQATSAAEPSSLGMAPQISTPHPDPDRIVGTVEISQRQSWPWQSTSPRYAYISNLAVAQPYRRQGLAAQLLTACETLACTWQLDHLYLHVMEDNPGAQQLYRRFGFQMFQAEDTLATWAGLQPRRLLLHKALALASSPSKSI